MRAGLIIGGLFLMFVGLFLFFTIIFTLFGILCGFIGFIMLIVGLLTSSPQRVVYSQPPSVSTTVYSQPPQPMPPQQSVYQGMKFCTACGTSNAKDSQYCGKCGRRFLE